MDIFAFSLFNGFVYGILLFMLSAGITLIFSMMGVFNFAHAAFFMLGAYFAYQISMFIGFWPALVIAPLLVGGIGAVVERYGLRPLYQHGMFAVVLFTYAIYLVCTELVEMIWGKLPVEYGIPESLNFTAFHWAGLDYKAYRLFLIVISAVILLALYGLITRTRVGLIIKASLTHPPMVRALGHNVPKIFMLVFGFGCALAALAGVIGGMETGVSSAMAHELGIIIFVIIIVGGLGSLRGAVFASLTIGILTNLAISYDVSFRDFFVALGVNPESKGIGGDLMEMTTGSISSVIPYLLMVVMLIFRPRGFFGTREM